MSEESFSSSPPSLPMPMTARPVGAPSGPWGTPKRSRRRSSAHRHVAPKHTSARRESSSVVTVRSASPSRSREPMRRSWRYLNRRSAFQRASSRSKALVVCSRAAASSSPCHCRMVCPSRSQGKSVGCRRSVSARNWLVPPSLAMRWSAPGCAPRRRNRATRSPWAARRSRLLSAMSGSGDSASARSSRGRSGVRSSASRGSGVSACRLTSAARGSAKPRRLSSASAFRSFRAAVSKFMEALILGSSATTAPHLTQPSPRRSRRASRLELQPSPPRGEGIFSDGRFARLAGADADGAAHGQDEDLAVADGAGAGGGRDEGDDLVDLLVGHHHFDLHLGQEVDGVLRAAIELGVALLPAEAAYLGHRHADDAHLGQRFLDVVQLERLDDGFDLLHRDLRGDRAPYWRSTFRYRVTYSRAEASHEKSCVMALWTSVSHRRGSRNAATARPTTSRSASTEKSSKMNPVPVPRSASHSSTVSARPPVRLTMGMVP